MFNMNKYIGHYSQLYGVQDMKMCGGKADGMRVLHVYNGKGLDVLLNLDKCCDILRVTVDGKNIGYIAPCGYVSSQHFSSRGSEFLKSFTAGF